MRVYHRMKLRKILEDEFEQFLEHPPHKPDVFWGGAVNVIASLVDSVVVEAVDETITDLYHPEFGTEWREPDGSLFKYFKEQEQRARRETISSLVRDGLLCDCDDYDTVHVSHYWSRAVAEAHRHQRVAERRLAEFKEKQ